MSSDYEKRLEAQIGQALKGLPELPAPRTLLPRVLAVVQSRAALPWYRLPWERWPVGWRTLALVVLLGSFGGLCFAGWELVRTEGFALAMREVSGWFSGLSAVGNAVHVLVSTLLLALRQLPTAVLAVGVALLVLSYAICMGVGAAWVRFAFARR